MATGGRHVQGNGDSSRTERDPVNNLTCPICLERYRRPKILACFHTFCQSCLQGVAGTSPTFHCPACRTTILLPPGGVSALQTNFYIEEDLDTSQSLPQRRLCDICTEDKEATFTCIECQQKFCPACRIWHDSFRLFRGHSVISLASTYDDGCGKSGAQSDRSSSKYEPEEMCPKHQAQRLLLHCKLCLADICMQCKLTQHEGHPTEDVGDSRARARSSLQNVLGRVIQRRQYITHLMQALNLRRDTVHQQQQQSQQDLQGHADTLHQWVNKSLDEAMRSVQDAVQDVDKPLQEQLEQLQNGDLALQAQQDLIVHVLKEGSEAHVVALHAQVSTTLLQETDLRPVEQELVKNVSKFHVQHSTSAVNQMQLREYIGVLRPVQPASLPFQSMSAADSIGPTDEKSSQMSAADAGKKKLPREFIYSQNPQSSLLAMCPISQGRLWVMYRPAEGSVFMMKLFDSDGQVLATVKTVVRCTELIAISDDTVMGCAYRDSVQIVSPDGTVASHNLGNRCHLLSCASNHEPFLRVLQTRVFKQVRFSLQPKLSYVETGVHWENMPMFENKTVVCSYQGHVSFSGEYIALVLDGIAYVYTQIDNAQSVPFSKYSPQKKIASSVCFCQIDGQELLLVVVDHEVHVVDHKDGGAFMGFLDNVTMNLIGPSRLAIDSDQHLWIGYNGGKVTKRCLPSYAPPGAKRHK